MVFATVSLKGFYCFSGTAYILMKAYQDHPRGCEGADNVWCPAGTLWCWERQQGGCVNLVLASVTDWNHVQGALSHAQRVPLFTIRWQSSLHAMGDKVLATYKHMRWPAEREMWASCTLTPIFFPYIWFIVNPSFFPQIHTFRTLVGLNSEHIPSTVLQSMPDQMRGHMSELVFHIQYRLAMVSSKYAVLRLFQDSQEHHWSCRFSAWFQLKYNKRLLKTYTN